MTDQLRRGPTGQRQRIAAARVEDGRATTTVSVAELRAHDICVDQIALFRATFGDGPVAISEANMSRAVDVGLKIEWLECLLAAQARAAYEAVRAPARAAYLAATAPAWAEYEAVRDQAWAAYLAATAPAWAAYLAATAPAWAEYEAVRDQAWAAYLAVRDQAWAAYEVACAPAWAAYRRALVGPLVRALRSEGAA